MHKVFRFGVVTVVLKGLQVQNSRLFGSHYDLTFLTGLFKPLLCFPGSGCCAFQKADISTDRSSEETHVV